MQVILYTIFSKRKNSTKNPDVISMTGTTKDLKLKDKCSRIKPSFFIADENRYTYLKAWGWYYFVTNIAYDINGAQYIDCELDVLGTWRIQIMGMSAFVRFSTSHYDVNVIDDRVAQDVTNTYNLEIEESSIIKKQGCYVISTVNNSPLGAGAASYILRTGDLHSLLFNLQDDQNIWDSLKDYFNDVSSSILNCIYVPFDYNAFTQGTEDVYIGTWNSQVQGKYTTGLVTETVDVTIPWRYNDFRRCSQFTRFILSLPFIGCVDIAPEKLIGHTTLTITLEANIITGHIGYLLSVDGNYISTYTGAFGHTIPVSTSQNDVQSFLNGISTQGGAVLGGAIGSTALGLGLASNPVGEFALVAGQIKSAYSLCQGVLQTTSAMHKSDFTTIGGYSGGFGEQLISQYYLLSITYDSRTEPSELTTLYGRPCYKVLNIGNLTGYVETIGFSIDTDAPDIVRNAINEAMDRGVYLE